MNGVEKHAEYYRGYLPDDRSVIPLAIVLTTIVALWLLIYLVSAVGPQPRPETAQSAAHASTVVISQPVRRHDRGGRAAETTARLPMSRP
jgi:hypothetical protein